jgi:hypothetical protein
MLHSGQKFTATPGEWVLGDSHCSHRRNLRSSSRAHPFSAWLYNPPPCELPSCSDAEFANNSPATFLRVGLEHMRGSVMASEAPLGSAERITEQLEEQGILELISRLATWRSGAASPRSASSSTIATPISRARSTRCFEPKACASSAPPSAPGRRTPLPSASCRACAESAWTTSSSSESATCGGSSESTCGTTTKNDRTEACRSRRRSRKPLAIGVRV